jgi:hypothetical protein
MKLVKALSLVAFAVVVLASCSGSKGSSRCHECPKFSKSNSIDKNQPS